jgi:hypothetical protein
MEEEKVQIPPETAKLIGEIVTDVLQRIIPLISPRMRRAVPYHCTGEKFDCGESYLCNDDAHSCNKPDSFSCSGEFSCTGGTFWHVLNK